MVNPTQGEKFSIGQYVKTGQILFSALVFGQLMFMLVVIYLVQIQGIRYNGNELNEMYLYAAPIITVFCLIFGFTLYKGKLKKIKEKKHLYEKLADYRSAQILRWALLEGASFFSIMAFLLTSNYLFIMIVGLIIGTFVLTIPSRMKFDSELDLSWEEKNQLSE